MTSTVVGGQAQRQDKKGAAEQGGPEDPYKEFKDEHLDAAEARKRLHTVNAAVNLAADLFDHVSPTSSLRCASPASLIPQSGCGLHT